MNDFKPSAYGDPLATEPCNLCGYLKKPLVIIRIFSTIISIIAFSTLSSGAWSKGRCLLNLRDSNCHFTIFVGVFALLLSVSYLIIDGVMPRISSVDTRKILVILDIAFSCLLTLFWLVAMGVIIGEWWKTPDKELVGVPGYKFTCIQVAASFSIFGVAIWAGITFLATRRFNLGRSDLFDLAASVNTADNRSFSGIPGGAAGVVSGSSVTPGFTGINETKSPQEADDLPYSVPYGSIVYY